MQISHAAAMAISDKIAKLTAELNNTIREGSAQGLTYDSEVMPMHTMTGVYPKLTITALVRPCDLIVE